MKQRVLSKNLGKDTHTRSVEKNAFQSQSTQTFEILTGEVLLNQPEPVFSQNAVTVALSKGGNISGVGIPGAFIDPITGNLHGVYEGLMPGQMVTLGFVDGNDKAPIILNRYPYQGVGNSLTRRSYRTPMFLAGYSPNDTLIGNISGSVIGLYTGINSLGGRLLGSIGIDAFTECNITAQTDILLDALVSAEVKSALVKMTGSVKAVISAPQITIDGSATVEINGNTKNFVTHLELDTALQSLITALSVPLVVTGTLPVGPVAATASWAIPPTIDITAAKTLKVLTG